MFSMREEEGDDEILFILEMADEEALRLWLDAFWEAPLASFKQHMETKDDPFGGQDNSGGGRP